MTLRIGGVMSVCSGSPARAVLGFPFPALEAENWSPLQKATKYAPNSGSSSLDSLSTMKVRIVWSSMVADVMLWGALASGMIAAVKRRRSAATALLTLAAGGWIALGVTILCARFLPAYLGESTTVYATVDAFLASGPIEITNVERSTGFHATVQGSFGRESRSYTHYLNADHVDAYTPHAITFRQTRLGWPTSSVIFYQYPKSRWWQSHSPDGPMSGTVADVLTGKVMMRPFVVNMLAFTLLLWTPVFLRRAASRYVVWRRSSRHACAKCAYPLARGAGQDTLTVCPECGTPSPTPARSEAVNPPAPTSPSSPRPPRSPHH